MSVRILLASPYNGRGGTTRWTNHILKYYRCHHDGIVLDLLPMDSSIHEHLFVRLWRGIWIYLRIIIKEWRMLRHYRYDVIHICTSANISLIKDYIMVFVAKRYHVHTIIHYHFGRIPSMAKNRDWEWRLLCKLMKKVDIAISIDMSSYNTLVSAGFSNVIYIPNPLASDVPEFVKKHEESIQRDETMILFAGNCLKTKGVYELVYACKDIPRIRLVLAGFIEKKTKKDLYSISKGELWLEILEQKSYEEVLSLMMRCGIFVLPSYTEGFPNVILESMACGCAIIGTNVGAIPELLKEEDGRHYGLVIHPRDTKEIIEAINYYLNNPELIKECRKNARIRVNKEYNMNIIWKELLLVWKNNQ